MARSIYLDKILYTNTTYWTSPRQALVIRKIGTDKAGPVTVDIDGKVCGYLHSTIMPMFRRTTNYYGLFDLEDLFLVVPPEKPFTFTYSTTGHVRILGEVVFLEPGEALPDELTSRFEAQPNSYWSYQSGSFSLDIDEAWPADAEYNLIDITTLSNERHVYDKFCGVSVSGKSVIDYGLFYVNFYVNGNPLESYGGRNFERGIEFYGMPLPPTGTTELDVFNMKHLPIEVGPSTRFEIRIMNVSGSSQSPDSGSQWSVECLIPYKLYKL